MCKADVARQALAASRARFDAAITRLGRDMAGPWKNRRDALHAELRANLFGRALPGETGCATERGIARLAETAYRDLRGDHDGVGPKAAKALLKVARFLPADSVRAVFPELVAATGAIGRLRDDDLPAGFDDFDRVVVDEVQDLTLLETAVVTELCRAIGRRRGRAPWLLMAGDAGQTVRPTGFDWGPLSDLLARRVGTPARFHLEEHLRCPSRIAEVVERASKRYVDSKRRFAPPSSGASAEASTSMRISSTCTSPVAPRPPSFWNASRRRTTSWSSRRRTIPRPGCRNTCGTAC